MTQLQQDITNMMEKYDKDSFEYHTLKNARIKLNVLEQMAVDTDTMMKAAQELSVQAEKLDDYQDLRDAIDEDQESYHKEGEEV